MANARRGVIIGMAAVLTASSPGSVFAQSRPLSSVGALERSTLVATQNAMAGVRIYRDKGCRGCHGARRTGSTVGPDLRLLQTANSVYELAAAMWNHLPGMGSVVAQEEGSPQPISSRQVGDLIAFLFSRGYFDEPGEPERGKKLFEHKQCVTCHQLHGRGGVIGPRLDFFSRSSPIQLAAGLWNHAPSMAEAMRRARISRPTLSGPELRDLASYLTSNSRSSEAVLNVLPGNVDEGERLFVEKGCVDCHGDPGTGGRVGPNLADRRLDRNLLSFASAMWNKAPAMIEAARRQGLLVPKLDGSEMAHLLAYLDFIGYLAPAGDPDRGRGWVTRKGCLDCHSLNGTGGSMAGDLADADHVDSPPAFISALWNHLTVQWDPERSRTDIWPQLSLQEASDIAAYLRH